MSVSEIKNLSDSCPFRNQETVYSGADWAATVKAEQPPQLEQTMHPGQGVDRRVVHRDAARNHAVIIDTARAILDADASASMHAIAKAAGVGQATLCRHFPTREALVMAVHRNDVRELVDAAPALLEVHSPQVALRLWLDPACTIRPIKHVLASALHTAMYAELAGLGSVGVPA